MPNQVTALQDGGWLVRDDEEGREFRTFYSNLAPHPGFVTDRYAIAGFRVALLNLPPQVRSI